MTTLRWLFSSVNLVSRPRSSFMQRILISLLCLLPLTTPVRGEDRPIPQDPKKQQQRFRDRLAYERRTW